MSFLFVLQAGISPRSLVYFGSHAPHRTAGIGVPIAHAAAAAPMAEHVLAEMHARVLEADATFKLPDGCHCVDLKTRECTCWDFLCGSCRTTPSNILLFQQTRWHFKQFGIVSR